jgi:hypothetical protein
MLYLKPTTAQSLPIKNVAIILWQAVTAKENHCSIQNSF